MQLAIHYSTWGTPSFTSITRILSPHIQTSLMQCLVPVQSKHRRRLFTQLISSQEPTKRQMFRFSFQKHWEWNELWKWYSASFSEISLPQPQNVRFFFIPLWKAVRWSCTSKPGKQWLYKLVFSFHIGHRSFSPIVMLAYKYFVFLFLQFTKRKPCPRWISLIGQFLFSCDKQFSESHGNRTNV